MLIQIAHNPVNAKLLTDDKNVKYLLSELLSYKVKGYEMTRKYQSGVWDGTSSLFNFKQSSFPTGMVYMVVDNLKKRGYSVQVIKSATPLPLGLEKPLCGCFTPSDEYKYQYDTVDRLLEYKQMIARIATAGGKSNVAKIAINKIGRKTLFITTRKSLMYQMKNNVESTMGVKVGIIGDSQLDVQDFINVGMVQTISAALTLRTVEEEVLRLTELDKNKNIKKIAEYDKFLMNRLKRKEITVTEKFELLNRFRKDVNSKVNKASVLYRAATANVKKMLKNRQAMISILEGFEFVIAEEAHESGSNEYFEVMKHCKNAHYRLALTATPFMKDDEEANIRLMACSGPVGITVSEKELIDKGIMAKPYFMFVNNPRPDGVFPSTVYTVAYDKGIVHNEERNTDIVDKCKWGSDKKLPTLVLVNRVEHGNILKKKLEEQGLKVDFIYGADEEEDRKFSLKRLENGDIDVLIGTNILDVGVDVPSIGMIILAAGGKAEVQLRQRIGRGLRRKKTGKNVTFIVDYCDAFNKHLGKHFMARQSIIKSTPGFSENIVTTFEGILDEN